MPLTGPIDFSRVGAIYSDWREAPAGRILAFAGKLLKLHAGQHNGEIWDPAFVLTADFDDDNALVVLSGGFGIYLPAHRDYMQSMSDTLHAHGPAADVTDSFEIGLSDLIVIPPVANPDPGTILAKGSERYLVVSLPDRANVICNISNGEVGGMGPDPMISLGKAVILPVPKR